MHLGLRTAVFSLALAAARAAHAEDGTERPDPPRLEEADTLDDAPVEPLPPEPAAVGPYLRIAGHGRTLRLTDAEGRRLETTEALILLDLPDAAAALDADQRRRKRVATACWVGAGLLTTATLALGVWYTDVPEGAPPGLVVVPLLIPVAVTTGLVVRLGGKRHLGDHLDPATLDERVAAHNRAVGQTDR